MNDYIAALLQGIVEGLTEFLPVSSTAHIILTQELLGIDRTLPFWKMFAVVIQLGAILSVIAFFRARLAAFLVSFRASLKSDWKASYRHPLALVLVSFVVTAIPCFLIDEIIGENLESLWVIAIALVIGGIAMVVIDRVYSDHAKTERLEEMSLRQAIAIGFFQILAAAFPGTSRSMATIAGGQIFGLSRSAALEFSFFLAIPVMFAASGFKLVKHLATEPMPSGGEWTSLAIGFVTSFVVAYGVIAWFIQWVRSRGFVPFAVYRVIAGTGLLLWLWLR
ncbi:Undecaprenyl-diphosphatase [Pirellula sp. SH-Sr6A]|uniref:undecaprenyl-diphosphate phosphatase n=1 Tax=Pirellula sp. SH-Sr6A TaxID=1632865 RepID=UPI00078BBA24|nr:undecaprenyl-diphosphate phosphatase [Pirellula sp. SH-Sr6A]AMV34682.1 Undecaprenyl-diphosphatase [Pirellula sp. SH-Sr6A]